MTALSALANHCGLPDSLETLNLPVGQPAPGLIAFRYKTGDSHIRRYGKHGLTGWQGWNKGAEGKQLWALKPEGQVQAVLLVEGETAAVCAHYCLKDKGWLVLATSGSAFPDRDDRNKVIEAWKVPVLLWPDQDGPGQHRWLPEGLSWLARSNPAVIQMYGDLRHWWASSSFRYGPDRQDIMLNEILYACWEHHLQNRNYDPVRYVPTRFNLGSAKSKAPSLDSLLPATGARPSNKKGMWHCGNTSNHQHGDRNPSMSVNLEQQVFYCFVCADRYNPTASGDNVALAAYQAGLSVDDYLLKNSTFSRKEQNWQTTLKIMNR